MRTSTRYLVLVLLVVVCFSLATTLQPRALSWSERARSDNVLKVLLGNGRKLFANQFFTEADVYFHSGYYPSIFDRRVQASQSPMVSGHAEHGHGEGEHSEAEEEHEKEMSFLGKPHDWIDAFGRHFFVTQHTHLHGGKEREILPWLKLSAELDPQHVETYTVASYWLRSRLGKVKEAEEFLRDGLRNNPNSPEILFELGRLYKENVHDTNHACNVWELALRRWREAEKANKKPDSFVFEEITVNLGRVEEAAGHLDRAVSYLEMAAKASPHPEDLERQAEAIKKELAARKAKTGPP